MGEFLQLGGFDRLFRVRVRWGDF